MRSSSPPGVPCASGGDVPKQFRGLAGRPLLAWTVSRFEAAGSIDEIVIVTAEEHLLHVGKKIVDEYGFPKVTRIVIGGATRQESVCRGLAALPLATDYVAIHDGARPLVMPADIDRVVELAKSERAAMLATPVADTVKRAQEGYIMATLDRRMLYLAQTPQVFQYDLIKSAHDEAAASGSAVTDDAALVEARGFKVRIAEASAPNFKVTTRDDLRLAGYLLQEEL